MSPVTKKILLIGGVAVAGFVAYKVIKGRKAAAVASPTSTKFAAAKLALTPNLQFAKMASRVAGSDLLNDLGLDEELGSLGGAYR
jgi:hypothetical protein